MQPVWHKWRTSNILTIMLISLVMVACSPTVQVTPPNPTEPQNILPTITPSPNTPLPAGVATVSDANPENQGVVVIQGIFDSSGQKLLELKPVHQYSYPSAPIPNQTQGQYKVTITYTTGDPTILPFDALISDDAGRTVHGFFELTIPISGEIASIRITDATGIITFAEIDSSQILR